MIKLGELVSKPLVLREQIADQQAAAIASASGHGASGADGSRPDHSRDERLQREKQWNEQAFEALHLSLAAALSDPEREPALFQRLCNRHELQLILMTPSELAALTHAQMQAWGTSGLKPHELRAVLHAVQRSPPNGKPAQQFIRLLKERVGELPPPTADAGAGADSSAKGGTAAPSFRM